MVIAMNKILVVCKIQDEILKKYASQIVYQPYLVEFSEHEWEELIASVKPKIILFGTIHFTKEMMRIWRNHQPNDQIFIVRKGISLGRCNLTAAREYNIDVFNLPGVNTIFVSNFMKKFLFKENNPTDCISIIGTGTIGQKIIYEAVNNNIAVIVHSKTLKNNEDLKKKKWFSDLPANCNIQVSPTIDQAFMNANKIAISIPYDQNTMGIVHEDYINKITPNALLVSVSEPKIFSDAALRALFKRDDLFVVIDHLASEFNDIYKIMGCDSHLRKNFFMVEEATAGVECQQAMSLAAIEKCMSIVSSCS